MHHRSPFGSVEGGGGVNKPRAGTSHVLLKPRDDSLTPRARAGSSVLENGPSPLNWREERMQNLSVKYSSNV